MTNGKSFGKVVTFDQHVENYKNKDELEQYKRLVEISSVVKSGNTNQGIRLMIKEFDSVERAIKLHEELKEKIFAGWQPESNPF